jgi:hypothetical protein
MSRRPRNDADFSAEIVSSSPFIASPLDSDGGCDLRLVAASLSELRAQLNDLSGRLFATESDDLRLRTLVERQEREIRELRAQLNDLSGRLFATESDDLRLRTLVERQEREIRELRSLIPPSAPVTASIRFAPSPAAPLNGIVAHLTRDCGGNVHDRHVVTISSSRPYNKEPMNAAKNVADLDTGSRFYSAAESPRGKVPRAPNSWICFDFGERRVVPSHYALRSYKAGAGFANPKSWTIEVSLDGETWIEVDRREDATELNAASAVALFEVKKTQHAKCVKLVNIGENHYGDDSLMLSAFELFGSLIEKAN